MVMDSVEPCDDGLCLLITCQRCNPEGKLSPDGGSYLLPSRELNYRPIGIHPDMFKGDWLDIRQRANAKALGDVDG